MQDAIIRNLSGLGFSEYESKVYLALLEGGALTAYELSRSSAVPSSKIYEVIARLVERGILLPLDESGKSRFAALPPRELFAVQRLRMETRLEELERQLADRGNDSASLAVWNVRDRENLVEQLGLSLRDTRKELLLSVWPEELVPVAGELAALSRRGVRVALLVFGSAPVPPGLERVAPLYRHPIEDRLYTEKGGRSLTLVSDSTRALTATVFADGGVEGAWSFNRGFVMSAEDYVKHDMYLMKIVERMGGLLEREFGKEFIGLRDVFNDGDARVE